MNKKLLEQFRDVNANPRIVIDYTKVKNLERLRGIIGWADNGCWKYYWYKEGGRDNYNTNQYLPTFPHRLVTVNEFYEEEWQPVSGEEVWIEEPSWGWTQGLYIGSISGRHYIQVKHGGVASGHVMTTIPTISIEEAEAWMKENGREVKIKN